MTENEKNKRGSEFTEAEKNRLAGNLVHALMDEDAPDDISDRLRDWFASPVNEGEKLAALEKYMSDYLRPNTDLMNEATLRQFNKLAARLGITASSGRAEIKKRPVRRYRMLGRAAAVLLPVMLAVGGWLWYQADGLSADKGKLAAHHVSVEAGDSRHIVLADGTEVTLAAGSTFDYSDNRRCELHGEGYFKVAKSRTPFVVRTAHINVTVLGTEFNLSAYDDSDLSEVRLYSGSVKVDYGNGTQVLKPGMTFSYNHATRETNIKRSETTGSRPANPEVQNGELAVYSLGEIFEALENKYAVDIVNAGSIDTAQRYTFALRAESEPIETVLNSLKDASGDFDYRIEGNTVIIEPLKK